MLLSGKEVWGGVYLRRGAVPLMHWARAMRVSQWSKNLLLGVPLVASHRLLELHYWPTLLLAMAAFCACASSVYIFNDILDIESDRLHPRKRRRPFAAGHLTIDAGLTGGGLLMLLGGGLALLSGSAYFCLLLLLYFSLTTLYSLRLKKMMALDVVTLTGLYTLRIMAGGAVTGIKPSPWLLAFSVFIFLNLALLKRYAELRLLPPTNADLAPGRGYASTDLELLRGFGTTSGYVAVLVLGLYINSPDVLLLYGRPQVLWLVCLSLLWWITRLWLLAHRGQVVDDPLVFVTHDRPSYLLGALIALLVVIAK